MTALTPADVVEQNYRDRLKPLAKAISFSCSRGGEFNAWVSTNGGSKTPWSIRFGDGLVHSSHLVCMAALSSPNCLRSIGDPDSETAWYKSLSKPLPWLDASRAYRQIHEELGNVRVRPSCPVRADFSDRVLTNVLDFVLYHELGHIAHRHLGPQQSLFERYTSTPGTGSRRVANHVKEMQADASGTIVSALQCMNADGHDNRMRGWGLGACLLTYLLGASGATDTLTGSSHPHPSVRLIHVGSVATSYADIGIEHEEWNGFISDLVDVVTELGLRSSAVEFLTTRKAEAHDEYRRMLSHFEEAAKSGLNPPRELLDVMSAGSDGK
jgi:hypothetical protein